MNRPATPLPRRALRVGAEGSTARQDHEYDVHAANAYPRLVEELQRLQNVVGEEDFELIEALLNDLGEA